MKDSSTATERVGRYQLLEPIGGGPSGAVARAKVFGVAGFERQFAVKRFLPELTVGANAQALSQAARSYGSLEHPRIARMSEFGVAQGVTFTAVEYVPGLDVFRLLQEAKLAGVAIPAGGALALVSQAARAVGYAHGRGLSHLGLSPTNIIVTGDGDVKVTDFGILAATMPPRPLESQRLVSRVPYLAPEQVAGEATSAATDVFVLGVIAYELVTGQRAYRGDTPAQIGQAILGGPPAEPALPRPIVRVLQRCLARSPFERFPDARALADALDAALRVAPVPGTRKDVGAQIKATLERYAQLNEGNVSGMVALNIAPPSSNDVATVPAAPAYPNRPEARTEPSPMPAIGSPSSPPGSPPGATTTQRELPRAPATVPGLAPPPVPVPPGVSLPQPGPPSSAVGSNTIQGLAPVKKPVSSIPSIAKPGMTATATPPVIPTRATPPPMPAVKPPPAPAPAASSPAVKPPAASPPSADGSSPALPPPPSRGAVSSPALPLVGRSVTMGWDAIPEEKVAATAGATDGRPWIGEVGEAGAAAPASTLATISDEPALEIETDDAADASSTLSTTPAAPHVTPGHSFDSTTGEMSLSQLEVLNKRSTLATSEITAQQVPDDAIASLGRDATPVPEATETAAPSDAPSPSSTLPGLAPPPSRPSDAPLATSSSSAPAVATPPAPVRPEMPASRSRLPLIAGVILGVGVLGAGAFVAYRELVAPDDASTTVATNTTTTGSATPTGAGAATQPQDPTGSSDRVGSGSAVDEGSDSTASTGSGSADSAGSDAAGSAGAGAGSDTASAGSGTDSSSGSGDTTGSATALAVGSGAGSAAGSAAGAPPTATATPSAPSDSLQVTSKPAGARVFIDGADQGVTPLKVPGSSDRHTLAVLLPGHDLYVAEVDGQGVYDVTLKPVTPDGGHAGIKVIKCKDKERYYVYVDGAPTGMTCPTERIDTVVGPHTVEVYDIVTETRRKFDIVVKDERLSVRVKIDD